MWVPATIEFEGNTWTNVGVRYKGNSSLTSGWRGGTLKLPLKLDFDEFEDHHPEMTVGYNTCELRYSTHSIGGISENDFICSAKVDHLVGD